MAGTFPWLQRSLKMPPNVFFGNVMPNAFLWISRPSNNPYRVFLTLRNVHLYFVDQKWSRILVQCGLPRWPHGLQRTRKSECSVTFACTYCFRIVDVLYRTSSPSQSLREHGIHVAHRWADWPVHRIRVNDFWSETDDNHHSWLYDNNPGIICPDLCRIYRVQQLYHRSPSTIHQR